jgi:hypothetical protein
MRSPADEAALQEDGFVVVPLLPPEVVAELRSSALAARGPRSDTITTDFMEPDRSLMRSTRALVEPILDEHLPAVVEGQRLVMATFVIKYPGEESSMFLHDDRTYVDEDRARALTVWIALDDVSPERGNGTLEVVPGSHRIQRGWAGSNTPDLIRPYERFLRERLQPVRLTAGSAVVYDTRLLHASAPNRSTEPRVALACAVGPVDEPLIHVVARGREVLVHRVTPEFFVEHHPREVEREMPGSCPVVDRYEDGRTLAPAAVEAVYPGPVTADPVVPFDVRGDGAPEHYAWLAHRDEPNRPAGGVRPQPMAPLAVHEVSAPVDQADGHLRIGPGGRGTVEVGGRRPVTVAVVEAPPVGAGLLIGAEAVDLVPDRRVALAVGTVATVWNDGPQDLDLVLERVPGGWWRRLRGRAGG